MYYKNFKIESYIIVKLSLKTLINGEKKIIDKNRVKN